MSIRMTISAVAVALAALLLVALAPTGAAAHGSHAHIQQAKHTSKAVAEDGVSRASAVVVEARMSARAPVDDHTASLCGDRGCCSNGHCSACGTAIAPASWSSYPPPTDILLLTSDASPPLGLASEGPPRPPKSFI